MIIGVDPTIEGFYIMLGVVIPFAIGVQFIREFIRWIKRKKKKLKRDDIEK